jgi:hypothetical protein
MSEFKTRAEYDAHVATWPKDQQWQSWPVPFMLATWRERIVIFFLWLGWAVVTVILFLALMWLLATIVENAGQRSEDHDHCLKHASNGYEIRECR